MANYLEHSLLLLETALLAAAIPIKHTERKAQTFLRSILQPVNVLTSPYIMWRRVMLTLIAISVTALVVFGLFVWLQERREA